MDSEQKQTLRTVFTAMAVGGAGFFVFSWLLSPVFSGRVVLPQNISLGGVSIQFYGLAIACAAAVGYWLAMRRRDAYGIKQEDADKVIFLVIILGFIGARLYHVVSEFGYYSHNLMQTFAVWNGGLAIYGAGIGGVAALYISRKYFGNYKLLQLLDWLVPSVVAGQIIGRFGNFFNYELYGYPTNLMWKMFVPIQHRIPPFELSQFFHPLFLYEAAGSAIILALLLKLKLRTGYLFFIWVFLYNVMRFFLEFLRIDSVIYGGIRVNAVVSAALAATALLIWYKLKTTNGVQNPGNN